MPEPADAAAERVDLAGASGTSPEPLPRNGVPEPARSAIVTACPASP